MDAKGYPQGFAGERASGPLPSVEVADALLDARPELAELAELAATFVTLPKGPNLYGIERA